MSLPDKMNDLLLLIITSVLIVRHHRYYDFGFGARWKSRYVKLLVTHKRLGGINIATSPLILLHAFNIFIIKRGTVCWSNVFEYFPLNALSIPRGEGRVEPCLQIAIWVHSIGQKCQLLLMEFQRIAAKPRKVNLNQKYRTPLLAHFWLLTSI